VNNIKTYIKFLALSITLSSKPLIAMEKETESELSVYNNTELECCVCFNEINPEKSDGIIVFNCNHYLCNECFENCQECPTCRGPLERAFRTFKDRLANEELNELNKKIKQLQSELDLEKTEKHDLHKSEMQLIKQLQQLKLEKDKKNGEKRRSCIEQKPITALLYEAIRNDSPEEIRQAVQAGADLNCKIVYKSPLLLAYIYKKHNAIKELLKLNAKFNDSPVNIKQVLELYNQDIKMQREKKSEQQCILS